MGKVIRTLAVFSFLAIVILNPAKAMSQDRANSYPDILLNNVWEIVFDDADTDPFLIKFHDTGYLFTLKPDIRTDGPTHKSSAATTDVTFTVTNGVVEFALWTLQFKGKIGKDGTIKGKGHYGHDQFTSIRIATNQDLVDFYGSKNVFSASPMSVLPIHKDPPVGKLKGEITVVNTFDFYVAVAIVGEKGASYLVAPPNGGYGYRLAPNGHYRLYYFYFNEPDALYEGDAITVDNSKITVTLEHVTGGNYNIRKSSQ